MTYRGRVEREHDLREPLAFVQRPSLSVKAEVFLQPLLKCLLLLILLLGCCLFDGAFKHIRRSDPVGFREVRRKKPAFPVLDTDDGQLAGKRLPPHSRRLHAHRLEPVGHALLALHQASASPLAVGVDARADVRKTGRLEERAVREAKLRGDQDAILSQKLVNEVVVGHEQSPIGAGGALRERRTVRERCPRAAPRSLRTPGPERPWPSILPAVP